MDRKSKILYKEWLFVVVTWTLFLYIYFFCAVWGTNDFMGDSVLKNYLNSWYAHLELILQAFFFASLFYSIDKLSDRTVLRKKPFGLIILIKSVLYIISAFCVALLVYFIFAIFEFGPMKKIDSLMRFITPRFLFSVSVYLIFTIISINFILQIKRKFGPGNLWKILTGKYHTPREERRIFLFLDLKDSTTIAEQLGHIRYSQLLQNCFHDISDIIIKYKAEIYQYVGDEIVLSWPNSKSLNDLNFIKAYFAFQLKLRAREDFYRNNFDCLPFFKGGMDYGPVTVAEIGDIKREIAYHGDVLNSASRIQNLCNTHNKKLLISENVAGLIPRESGFEMDYIGQVTLRGKIKELAIYSLELI